MDPSLPAYFAKKGFEEREAGIFEKTTYFRTRSKTVIYEFCANRTFIKDTIEDGINGRHIKEAVVIS